MDMRGRHQHPIELGRDRRQKEPSPLSSGVMVAQAGVSNYNYGPMESAYVSLDPNNIIFYIHN